MKTMSKEKAEQNPSYFNNKARIIRKLLWMQFVLLVGLLILPLTVSAQGYYWGSPVSPGYDRSSVVEINGTVLQADLAPRSGPATLRVKSEGETLTVTIGPEWYVRRLNFDVQIGDKLSVKGSKMKAKDGKIYLTAASINNLRTGKFFELRDQNGRPLWSSKRISNKEGRP